MADSSVARRYAKALIDLGIEGGNTDELISSLESAYNGLKAGTGELLNALSHPALVPSERRQLLEAVMPKLGITGTVESFLSLLIDKRRFGALPLIVSEARTMADEVAGRATAFVSTARPLTADLEAEVKKTLELVSGKTITVKADVDPSLIGGMVARIGGHVYDASVRTQLANLRNSLLDSKTTTSVGDA